MVRRLIKLNFLKKQKISIMGRGNSYPEGSGSNSQNPFASFQRVNADLQAKQGKDVGSDIIHTPHFSFQIKVGKGYVNVPRTGTESFERSVSGYLTGFNPRYEENGDFAFHNLYYTVVAPDDYWMNPDGSEDTTKKGVVYTVKTGANLLSQQAIIRLHNIKNVKEQVKFVILEDKKEDKTSYNLVVFQGSTDGKDVVLKRGLGDATKDSVSVASERNDEFVRIQSIEIDEQAKKPVKDKQKQVKKEQAHTLFFGVENSMEDCLCSDLKNKITEHRDFILKEVFGVRLEEITTTEGEVKIAYVSLSNPPVAETADATAEPTATNAATGADDDIPF